jgi:hypothetical protein
LSVPDQICNQPDQKAEEPVFKGADRFEEILAESVYEGLSWVSGLVAPILDASIEGATKVEIGVRKSKMNMKDLEAFEKGMERIFGVGAKVVEYRILKILYSKLELNEQIEQNFRFSDEVQIAKGLYRSRLGTT